MAETVSKPDSASTTVDRRGEDPAGSTTKRRGKWRRRLLYAFAAMIVLLAVLVAGAPYLASTKPVWGYALGEANARLVGSVNLDGLSVGWGGPLEARGIKIVDAEKRSVLEVERVSCAGGLWGLITGGLDLGHVVVESPKAVLYINETNEISLIQALQLKDASPPDAEDSQLPEVRGKLMLTDGEIRAARQGGAAYEVTGVNATVNVDTLAKITADLGLKLADGVPLTAEADIRELVSNGELQPMSATGTLKVQTGGEVRLAPLSELLMPGQRLEGTASLQIDAAGDAENLKGNVVAKVTGLQTATRAADQAAPLNLGVTAQLERSGRGLTAKANLSGDAGSADVDATYQLSDSQPGLPLDRILAAVQTGDSIDLPHFTVDMTGGIDLARLGQAVPGILHLKDGLEITAGRVEIDKLSVRGGAQPSAKGDVKVIEVAAIDSGRPVRVEPITLGFDAALVAGEGLRIAMARLKSSFAEVTAQGVASNIQASFRADLARLQQELGQIIDLSSMNLAGDVAGTVEVKRKDDDLKLDFKADASGLKITKAVNASAPVSLGIAGQVEQKGEVLTAQANLTGDAGDGEIALTYQVPETRLNLDAQRVLSAVLSGEALTLPECTLSASGKVDLARLGNALPGILSIKPGQEITGGQLEVAGLSVRGGAEPSAKGTLTLTEVTATDSGRTVRVEPITFAFDASLVTGQGLQLALAELKSGFAELSAQGAASDIKSAFRADLSRLHAEVGQIVDLSGFTLGGDVSGTLELARTGDDRVDLKVSADAKGMRYAAGERVLDLQHATLRQSGHLTLADKRVTRLDVAQIEADLDGQVALSGAGSFDLAGRGFRADVNVSRGDVGYAAARLATLGIDGLAGYTGSVSGNAVAERTDGRNTLVSNGSLTASNLGRDGTALCEGEARLEWKNLELAADGSRVSADSAELRSTPATLHATGVLLKTVGKLQASADLKGSADLSGVLRAVATITDMEQAPAVSGQLGLDAKVATAAGVVTFAGKGGVEELEVGAGEKTVREKRLDFEFDGKVDDQKNQISLTRFKLASTPLSAEVNGTAAQYTGVCELALKGRYEASWEELTTILHELAPETAETIIVAGKSASEFEITGPLRSPKVTPTFRGVGTETEVKWASAKVVGVDMGATVLKPTLESGRLSFPKTTIPAADGKVNIGGAIDFAPADPTLDIKGKLAVLENVAVNPLLSSSLLGRINPIFHNLAKVDGRISLDVEDVYFPFGESAKTRSSGKGQLDLGRIKVQPAGILAELLALGGFAEGDMVAVQIGKVDLVVRDGRIHYDNFTLAFSDDFDLKFRGSVGLDSTLDLIISIPVKEGMLRRLGVQGPTTEMFKQGSNMRVELPLSGTREQPRLDFSKVDVASLLKGMLPTSPEGVIKGLLDGLQPPAPSRDEREERQPTERREDRPRDKREVKPRKDPKAPPKDEPKEPTTQPRKRRATRRP